MKSRPRTIPAQPRGNDLKRLGILGGTFDPVHCGHLILATQLRDVFGLDLVLLVPCNRSPHKPRYRPAPSRHRLEMARLAALGRRGLAVSDVEICRGGISYTVDTVRQLRRLVGPRVEMWLLVGTDAYLDIPAWKDFRSVVRECFLGVACRPGYKVRRLPKIISSRARFAEITQLDVSSTDLRRRLRAGLSVGFLVPERVEAYIKRNGLYGPAKRLAEARPGRPLRAGRRSDRSVPC